MTANDKEDAPAKVFPRDPETGLTLYDPNALYDLVPCPRRYCGSFFPKQDLEIHLARHDSDPRYRFGRPY